MNRVYKKKLFLIAFTLGLLTAFCCNRVQQGDELLVLKDIESVTPHALSDWKFHLDDVENGHSPDLDDSDWKIAKPNYTWGMNPICWFRKEVVVPDEMAGKAVFLNVIVDDKGIVFVNGQRHHAFDWYGKAFLTPKASAGEKFLLAVKGLNGLGSGHLVSAELVASEDTLVYGIDEKIEYLKPLTRVHSIQVNDWRYKFGDNDNAHDPDFDDSNWELVDVGNRWEIENSNCWLRKQIVIPEKVNGFAIDGSTVTFTVTIDDGAEIYVDGEHKQADRTGRSGEVVLSEHARAGDSFFIAVKGINTTRSGILLDARLTYSKLQPLAEQAVKYLKEVSSLTMLLERIPAPDPNWGQSMVSSLDAALTWQATMDQQNCHELLKNAEKKLAPAKKAANEFPVQIKGPYLQNVTKNSITVMWETDTPSDSRVDYGTSELLNLSVHKPEKVRIHEVTIDNLQPETKYHYRAISGKLSSTTNTFRTAIHENTPFRFIVWGDNHNDGPRFEQNVNRMITFQPDLAINVGDMVLTGSNYDHWGYEFFIPGRNLFKNTPLFPSLGNHEYGGYGTGNRVIWYETFFSLPGTEYYYSYNYGNSHFIHLNPHTNSPFGVLPGSEQYKWLIADLESDACKNAKWRFVIFHEPPMTEPLMAEHIVPLLEKHDVNIQFSGHIHAYVRSQNYKPDGTYYIITGGGGGSLSNMERLRERQQREANLDFYEAVHHFSMIDINGDQLTFRAVDIDGNVFDSFQINK